MRRTLVYALLLSVCLTVLPHSSAIARAAQEDAVRRAALDYIEGFYEGDPDKLRRGLHPEMVKYGYHRSGPDAPYQGSAMSDRKSVV